MNVILRRKNLNQNILSRTLPLKIQKHQIRTKHYFQIKSRNYLIIR